MPNAPAFDVLLKREEEESSLSGRFLRIGWIIGTLPIFLVVFLLSLSYYVTLTRFFIPYVSSLPSSSPFLFLAGFFVFFYNFILFLLGISYIR
jgi:hypothetical protein